MLIRGLIGGIILFFVVLVFTIWIIGRGPGKVEISGLQIVEDSDAKRVTIIFHTNKKALAEVMLGIKEGDYRDSFYQDPTAARRKRKDHEIVIEKLSPGTTYHYQVAVRDDAGKILATSRDVTFTLEEKKVEPPVEPKKPPVEPEKPPEVVPPAEITDAQVQRAVRESLEEVRK